MKRCIKYALFIIASHNFMLARGNEYNDGKLVGEYELTDEKKRFINEFENMGKKWIDIAKNVDDDSKDFQGFVQKKIKNIKEIILSDNENESAIKQSSDESNEKKHEIKNEGKRKKSRSTSSSAGEKGAGSSGSKSSLQLSEDTDSSSSGKENNRKKNIPQSSAERTGWRKYHRKCATCPEDMKKKWRDPSIHWICGAYQRARRSFKSACMMYYRNCQDGTMFVKIHDHKCKNDSVTDDLPHGEHFFYDYQVKLGVESSKSDGEESSLTIDDDSDN